MAKDSVDKVLSIIQTAEVVIPCDNFEETLTFFTQKLGFSVALISPADKPSIGVLDGHGIRIRIEQGANPPSHTLRLNCDLSSVSLDDGEEVIAPNGTRILIKEANPPLSIPPEDQSLVISKLNQSASWITGRAGMLYRDLIPNRQGGRFIASHIKIPRGGLVPDYVHYHKVRFQMIFCYKGWVKVAYEDQGDPILLKAGDCFLQPPEIRHRVLESSDGLEVISSSIIIGQSIISHSQKKTNIEYLNDKHSLTTDNFLYSYTLGNFGGRFGAVYMYNESTKTIDTSKT